MDLLFSFPVVYPFTLKALSSKLGVLYFIYCSLRLLLFRMYYLSSWLVWLFWLFLLFWINDLRFVIGWLFVSIILFHCDMMFYCRILTTGIIAQFTDTSHGGWCRFHHKIDSSSNKEKNMGFQEFARFSRALYYFGSFDSL